MPQLFCFDELIGMAHIQADAFVFFLGSGVRTRLRRLRTHLQDLEHRRNTSNKLNSTPRPLLVHPIWSPPASYGRLPGNKGVAATFCAIAGLQCFTAVRAMSMGPALIFPMYLVIVHLLTNLVVFTHVVRKMRHPYLHKCVCYPMYEIVA
jgi:hypothetical protein